MVANLLPLFSAPILVKLILMNSKELIQLMLRAGWIKDSQKGSHAQFVHPTKKGKVTVPVHGKKDIPIGTLKAIKKQAGLK